MSSLYKIFTVSQVDKSCIDKIYLPVQILRLTDYVGSLKNIINSSLFDVIGMARKSMYTVHKLEWVGLRYTLKQGLLLLPRINWTSKKGNQLSVSVSDSDFSVFSAEVSVFTHIRRATTMPSNAAMMPF